MDPCPRRRSTAGPPQGSGGCGTTWRALGLDAGQRWLPPVRLTREDHELREWFAGECADRGLDLTTDRMGNQWAWWGDPDAAVAAGDPGVVIGSHLDSVPDGGAFDGPLGVVGALAAVDQLRPTASPRAARSGVVNFADEEGARFGVACAGSRVITGALGADRARGLADHDGVTMAEAMRRAGRDPPNLGRDDETLAPDRRLRRAARRAGPRPGRPRRTRSESAATSGRTAAGGSTFPARPTTPGPPASPTARTPMLGLAAMIIAARRAAERRTAASPRSARCTSCPAASTPSRASPPGGWTPAARDADAVLRVVARGPRRRRATSTAW